MSGEGGDRTRDLLLATQALSQRELHPHLLTSEPGRDRTFDHKDQEPSALPLSYRPVMFASPSGTARIRTWDRPIISRMLLPA